MSAVTFHEVDFNSWPSNGFPRQEIRQRAVYIIRWGSLISIVDCSAHGTTACAVFRVMADAVRGFTVASIGSAAVGRCVILSSATSKAVIPVFSLSLVYMAYEKIMARHSVLFRIFCLYFINYFVAFII